MLSQAEIASLLDNLSVGSLSQGEQAPVSASAPAPETKPKLQHANLFSGEQSIVRGRLPGLESILESFARRARGRLSQQLSRNVTFNYLGLENEKWAKYSKSLPLPSSMHLIRLPPLLGHALLVVSTPLVYGLVETSFGGGKRAQTKRGPLAREFTAIENRLVAKTVHILLEDIRDSWQGVSRIEAVYSRAEFNVLALSFVTPSDSVFISSFELEFEAGGGSLQLVLPDSLLSPIRSQLASGLGSQSPRSDNQSRAKLKKNLLKTEVELRAMLGEGRVKVRDVLALSCGDILYLDTPKGGEAVLSVSDQAKFKGELGVSAGRKCFKVRRSVLP